MLTRDQILGLDDLPRQRVEVPEWRGHVFVRAMTGAERDQLERMLSKGTLSRASIAAFVTVDEAGGRLFTDKDVEKLADKHGGALERIVSAALAFNALDSGAIEEGKDG